MKKESIIPKENIILINDFIEDQDVCERSKISYRINITQFFNWVFWNGYDPSKLSRVDVLNFKNTLEKEGKSPSTIDAYITAVRKYFKWTSIYNKYTNIAEGIRGPKKTKTINKMPLTLDQAKALIKSVDTSSPIGIRDKAIIKLLLKNGLRIKEISLILIKDISELSGKKILYIQSKGHKSKDDFIQLTNDTYDSLIKCIRLTNVRSNDEPLFKSFSPNNPGDPITPRSISKIVKTHLLSIGLDNKKYTAHSLRHTAACLLIGSGLSIYEVQLFMRHKDPSITEIYTRFMEDQIKLSNVCGSKMDEIFEDVI